MTIDFSKLKFESDTFNVVIPSGDYLTINKVNESVLFDDVVASLDAINIQIEKRADGKIIQCPSVIGIGNGIVEVRTEHKEYLGKILNSKNMDYCTLEVFE